jgi:diacylglycerol kinase (ATP)
LGRGATRILVGGGDGTVSAVAHLVAQKEAILGVLPLGTGNAFARDLGLPLDLEGAVEVAAAGHTERVDLAQIGDRPFLNVATVGLSTLIARNLDKGLKRTFGRMAYFVSLVRALRLIRPFAVRLCLDGREESFETMQVVIGNGRFHAGPFPVAPDAGLDTGYLSIYALASKSKSDFLKLALRLHSGTHVELEEVRSYCAKEGRLETAPSRDVTIDGETCLKTPADFRVYPGALEVLTPRDEPQSAS